MSAAYWVCAVITAISAFVSLGYATAGLVEADGKGRTESLSAFARSLAPAVVAVIAAFVGSLRFLAAVAIAMVIVQGADAVIGG